jgi:sugar phosphate isomerase/epimerase
MEIGIFAKTFIRPTLEEVLETVASHGLHCVQFNFACAGLPSLPDQIGGHIAKRIRAATISTNMSIAAVSGTFNMIHPDPAKRLEGLRSLQEIARVSRGLGAPLVTLCSGTRDSVDMWRHHRENASREAWRDLICSMSQALEIAEQYDVTLGIEPEIANVIDSARNARRFLDEMRSPRLKVIMDAANLFHPAELPRMREVIEEAFQLIGGEIVLAHAKDVTANEVSEIQYLAAGRGSVDFEYYLALLSQVGYRGPLILHGLAESEVPESVRFLRMSLATAKVKN